MPVFLMRFSYTPDTWAALMKDPEDRRDAARAYVEEVGGSLLGFWYALGEYDGCMLLEAPDEISGASVALAIAAGGALAKVDTTVLMTVDDTLTSLDKGRAIQYRKPGAPVPVGIR